MFSFREFFRRLQFLFVHHRLDEDLAEEIGEHLHRAAAENIARGLPPEEARYAALRQFGNLGLQQERARQYWSFPAVDSFLQDLRFGARLMLKSPVLSLVAIAKLALGIGANAAVFAVAKAAFWHTFPYAEPNRLAILWASNQRTGWTEMQVSFPDIHDWTAAAHSFQSISGYTWTDYKTFNLSSDSGAERVRGIAVLPNLLPTLGLHPALSRDFRSDEFSSGSDHVVLLANSVWRTRFGSNPDITGKTIHINREPYVVAGVLPTNFEIPDLGKAPELLVPLALDSTDAQARTQRILLPIGRLKSGVTPAAAEQELKTLRWNARSRVQEAAARFPFRFLKREPFQQ